MASIPAHRVSTAVLERLGARPARATVVASSAWAVHADLNGFVVSLTDPRSALMPNGIALAGPLAGAVADHTGDQIWIAPGLVRGPRGSVTWDADAPPGWDPRIASWSPDLAADIARRAHAIRRGVNAVRARDRAPVPPGAWPSAAAVAALLRAVADRRPESAAAAAAALLGSGPGLTPLGDDLLAGAAATVAAIGEAAGFAGPPRRAWLRALAPADLRRHTTSLSATLLELAGEGRGVEPLHTVLDQQRALAAGFDTAVARLHELGASTGRAYAFSAGACAPRLTRIPESISQTHDKEPT